MLNPHMDRSPIGRASGWLVLLTGVALTVTLAGLSLTAAGATPAEVAAPRPPEPEQQAGGPTWVAVMVTDQLDRTVPNASVTVSSEATRTNSEGRTGRDGEFIARGLPVGVYQISVSKPGFKKASRTIALEAGRDSTARFVLELGSLQETVVVSAAAGAPATTDPLPVPRQVGGPPVVDPCAGSQEGGCVLPPRKLIDAKPVYPASCVRAGTSGTVIVRARLRADGFTGDVRAEPGSDPELATAAEDAVRIWQYSPVRLDGVAFPVDMTVTVKFEIVRQL